MRLLRDPARHQGAGRRVERDLPGDEQEAAGADRLAVGPDGAGRLGGRDGFAHRPAPLGGFDDAIGLDAARADPNATDAPVDDRADPLQIRFESPRRDVIGVAQAAPDRAGLAANLTQLWHT